MNNNINIRKAKEEDSQKLWEMMRDLAIFEKYINIFTITPEIIKESAFKKSPPDFYCFVATNKEEPIGMLVYYFLPYTAQNKPSIYIKELYVDKPYRGQKVGKKLMLAIQEEARKHNCQQIQWKVAPWNTSYKIL